MKKVICLIAISLMVVSTCQAKTIVIAEDQELQDIDEKQITITDQVEDVESISINQLKHEIQQHQARSDYQLEQKAEKVSKLTEIMTALKVTDTDGTLSIEK